MIVFTIFQLVVCIIYVPQISQTTDSTRAVQGSCYNHVDRTVYTLAAGQQIRRQHHTRAVVCPRCITAVAPYLLVATTTILCRGCNGQ